MTANVVKEELRGQRCFKRECVLLVKPYEGFKPFQNTSELGQIS